MVKRTTTKIFEENSSAVFSNENQDSWLKTKWRPAAAWSYIVTCSFDFILFPIAWSLLLAIFKQDIVQWNPITLQGAGLYHISMGAILGVAAWTRGKEKIAHIESSTSINSRMKTSIPDTDLEDADNIRRR